MSGDGKSINYQKLKQSEIFKEYAEKLAPQLQNVKIDNISENEKKAFFISILFSRDDYIPALGCEVRGGCIFFFC